ncbi:hypothetical protein CHUAL_003541 [Chamberlinius hualienensis]
MAKANKLNFVKKKSHSRFYTLRMLISGRNTGCLHLRISRLILTDDDVTSASPSFIYVTNTTDPIIAQNMDGQNTTDE